MLNYVFYATVILDILERMVGIVNIDKVCLGIEELLKLDLFYGDSTDRNRVFSILLNFTDYRPLRAAQFLVSTPASSWTKQHFEIVVIKLLKDPRPSVNIEALNVLEMVWQTTSRSHCRRIVDIVNSEISKRELVDFCLKVLSLTLQWLSGYSDSSALLLWSTNAIKMPNSVQFRAAVSGLCHVFPLLIEQTKLEAAVAVYDLIYTVSLSLSVAQDANTITPSELENLTIAQRDFVNLVCSLHVDFCGRINNSKNIFLPAYLPTDTSSEFNVVSLNLGSLVTSVASMLKSNRNYVVLESILQGLPCLASHKSLHSIELTESIVIGLCELIKSVNHIRSGYFTDTNTKSNNSCSMFLSYAFEALKAYVPYLSNLSLAMSVRVVDTFLMALQSPSWANKSMSALILMIFEVPKSIRASIAPIVLKLMQLSSSSHLSESILHFMFFLAHDPEGIKKLGKQELQSLFSLFAYFTDGDRFHSYLVHLAHEVLIVWFLKLPVDMRTLFAPMIVQSLKRSCRPVEESSQDKHNIRASRSPGKLGLLNEDSRDRPRGGSLNEYAMTKLQKGAANNISYVTLSPNMGAVKLGNISLKDSRKFCNDLTAVTIDNVQLYTNLPAGMESMLGEPKRPPIIDPLLNDGDTERWLLGDVMVCITVVRGPNNALPKTESVSAEYRRRHKSDGYKAFAIPENVNSPPESTAPLNCANWAEVRVHRASGETGFLLSFENNMNLRVQQSAVATLFFPESCSASLGCHQAMSSTVPLSPQSVFNMLYGSLTESALPIPQSQLVHFSCEKLHSLVFPQVHSIGVLFVDNFQSNEEEIFSNHTGSMRYTAMLRRLGGPVDLSKTPHMKTGGWDMEDGRWLHVRDLGCKKLVFHPATGMRAPPRSSGSNLTRKKRIVGNDLTVIIYKEPRGSYDLDTVPTQCLFSHILVEALPQGLNRVKVMNKDIPGLGKVLSVFGQVLVSDSALGDYVSYLALVCDLAGQLALHTARDTENPSGNLGLSRLLQLRRIRHFAEKELSAQSPGSSED